MMKRWLAVLFLFSAATSADELKNFEFEAPAQKTPSRTSTSCGFENLTLPAGVRIYAAGGYKGRELPFQIDQSGHEATQFDIAVNSPAQPVVLMLGSYEPAIWNIGWTKGTRIVAAVVSGYYRQAVAGLESTIPVLNSTYENKGACGHFYVGDEQNTSINPMTRALNPVSRKLFNRPVDLVYPGDGKGKILVGDALPPGAKLVTSTARSPEDFRDKNAPLAGQAGIDSAVAKGVLRPATSEDAAAWAAAVAANTPAPDVPPVAGRGTPQPAKPSIYKAYVVLGTFTYPSGLYGANSVTFFIARGVPQPTGNPGHSAVYDFNSLRCRGATCGLR
jgi:hypothetical protein